MGDFKRGNLKTGFAENLGQYKLVNNFFIEVEQVNNTSSIFIIVDLSFRPFLQTTYLLDVLL